MRSTVAGAVAVGRGREQARQVDERDVERLRRLDEDMNLEGFHERVTRVGELDGLVLREADGLRRAALVGVKLLVNCLALDLADELHASRRGRPAAQFEQDADPRAALGALRESDAAESRQHGALARALRADHNELRHRVEHGLEAAAGRAAAHQGAARAVGQVEPRAGRPRRRERHVTGGCCEEARKKRRRSLARRGLREREQRSGSPREAPRRQSFGPGL
jgi:hypothetical protein